MTHIEALSGEGVGLHLNIRAGDLVDEAGLANIWKTWRSTNFYLEKTDKPLIMNQLLSVIE